MPVTDTKTLHRELDKFGPESKGRNEEFIKALTNALKNELLNYFNRDVSSPGSPSLAVRRANRLADIRQMSQSEKFQIGDNVFSIFTDAVATELGQVPDGEAISNLVTKLQRNLLEYYRQAPADQRLRRLGEISLMFRASTFQVGQQTIKTAAEGASATTDIASFQGTYGCPPGTSCIDGNCV